MANGMLAGLKNSDSPDSTADTVEGIQAAKNAVENNSLESDDDELQREHGNPPVKVLTINPRKLNVLDGDGNSLKAGGGGTGKRVINK
ncbi:VENN motif pre-toxin domain-containing protein [Pantoea sp. C2G6]|uniref:VENN motif pre-toxin domain-containing protein n=1 Tax=Pantoea sp. C2G6 TaxID=3243084 RepID=UPI003EDAB47C